MLLQMFYLILTSVFLIYYFYQYNCKAGNYSSIICVYCSAIITLISFVRGIVHTDAS